jgi:hypothetical protein
VRCDAAEKRWEELKHKGDLSLQEKVTRKRVVDLLSSVRRREERIFSMLQILFRSRLLRAYLITSDYSSVVKACCRSEFTVGMPADHDKLDMWRPTEPKLISHAYITASEWKVLLEAAQTSVFPGLPNELTTLSRETIRQKCIPGILREIVRVERQTDRCAN